MCTSVPIIQDKAILSRGYIIVSNFSEEWSKPDWSIQVLPKTLRMAKCVLFRTIKLLKRLQEPVAITTIYTNTDVSKNFTKFKF